MELLILLASRPGALVTRQEIAARFWGDDVFVDIDSSINRIVAKLRLALHDDPDRPRFIETVVGKGYRLIAPLDPPIRSIAVLPFASRTELTTMNAISATSSRRNWSAQLARVPALRVVPGRSVDRIQLDHATGRENRARIGGRRDRAGERSRPIRRTYASPRS